MSKQQEIYEFIATLNPKAKDFDAKENLLESGLLDSVAMMNLVVWCEEHFNITIDTDDLTPDNFSTLEAITEFIEKVTTTA